MLKRIILSIVAVALLASPSLAQSTINGAGASFPYAIYSAWGYGYNLATKIKVNYQSIGSGGGIKQISAGTVDFGATDEPLSVSELDEKGLIQFPAIVGGVVLIVNIEGVPTDTLILDADLVAAIFQGKINNWSDKAIVAKNPNLKLPNQKITIIHRSDSSGTTAMFTNYLEGASIDWKNNMGSGKTVNWTTGVGGKGNDGVAGYVKQVKGSIGYVEFSYAKNNKIAYTKLINEAGEVLSPTNTTFNDAASSAKWDKANGYNIMLTNQSGKNAWPIVGASFILLRKDKPEINKEVMKFFDWSFKNGDKMAKDMFYIPLPESLKAEIISSIK